MYKAFGGEILPNWLDRMGYPVLNVSFHPETVNVSAETFSVYRNYSIKNESWKIPFELFNVDSRSTQMLLGEFNSSFEKMLNVRQSSSNLTIISRNHILGKFRSLKTLKKCFPICQIFRILSSKL